MEWNTSTQKRFDAFLLKVPVFHRTALSARITNVATGAALSRGAAKVEDTDIVYAVISDIESPLYSMVYHLMGEMGFCCRDEIGKCIEP
jgi:hypothetical protein